MVGAVGTETISPHVMIDAALHVLAAWVASGQTHTLVDEREEEIEELILSAQPAPPRKVLHWLRALSFASYGTSDSFGSRLGYDMQPAVGDVLVTVFLL
jgi:hypothetical protein